MHRTSNFSEPSRRLAFVGLFAVLAAACSESPPPKRSAPASSPVVLWVPLEKQAATRERLVEAAPKVADRALGVGRSILLCSRDDQAQVAWAHVKVADSEPDRALRRGLEAYKALGVPGGPDLAPLRVRQPCVVPPGVFEVELFAIAQDGDLSLEMQRASARYREVARLGGRVLACAQGPGDGLIESLRSIAVLGWDILNWDVLRRLPLGMLLGSIFWLIGDLAAVLVVADRSRRPPPDVLLQAPFELAVLQSICAMPFVAAYAASAIPTAVAFGAVSLLVFFVTLPALAVLKRGAGRVFERARRYGGFTDASLRAYAAANAVEVLDARAELSRWSSEPPAKPCLLTAWAGEALLGLGEGFRETLRLQSDFGKRLLAFAEDALLEELEVSPEVRAVGSVTTCAMEGTQ